LEESLEVRRVILTHPAWSSRTLAKPRWAHDTATGARAVPAPMCVYRGASARASHRLDAVV